ncbi:MAG: hypothetical protein ABFS42_13685 [Candidatus Krumholzibacteriota bacterium]
MQIKDLADPEDPGDADGDPADLVDGDPADLVDADPVDLADADPADPVGVGADLAVRADVDAGARTRARTCTRT